MEKYKVERIEEMKKFIEEVRQNVIRMRLKKIEQDLINNVENIRSRLMTALEELILNKKDGVLVISFLRSSYIMNCHEFYIAYYEGELFVEEEPESLYLDMKILFDDIEEDLNNMEEKLRKKYVRIFKGEKEEIRRWYIEQIYMRLGTILRKVLGSIQSKNGIDVYYGSYMDELELIGKV